MEQIVCCSSHGIIERDLFWVLPSSCMEPTLLSGCSNSVHTAKNTIQFGSIQMSQMSIFEYLYCFSWT